MCMQKVCNHGFENAITKNVNDFQVQIYIFFKGTPFCNTGAREKNRNFQNMIRDCTYKLFIVD